jgi:CRP-like cAMP-binding protein
MVVYVVSGLVMLAGSVFRPAQAAILPSLTDTPEQLTAMNVVSSTIESVGFFAGPALGGLLLVATSPQVVFIVSALSCVWSALMLVGLGRLTTAPRRTEGQAEDRPRGSMLRESVEGFRMIGHDKYLRTLVALFTAQTVVAGALNVFVVVMALRLYDSGAGTVGTLNAALGVGGVLGAAAAATLVSGQRLVKGFAFGLVFWGVPLLLVGGVPVLLVGMIGLAVIGIANTIIDVSGYTLLQRAVPDEVLARVFGVLETVLVAGMGLGALITPPIITLVGVRGALLIVGGFLPLLTTVTWNRLRSLEGVPDAPEEHVALLRSLPVFESFPPPTLELLAAHLERHDVAPGEVVIRQGEIGDRFYVVESGRFDVEVDGAQRAELGLGDFFGEIALLRDVPRTATVTAGESGVLLSLSRDYFVPAVRGELLKSLPLFRPLPPPTLEFLASKLRCHEVESGEVVIREGETGDRFYVIAEGEFEVASNGGPPTELHAGDFFGEIALLRNVERTATVTARDPGVLFSLSRDEFVPAVTGSAPSNAAADEVVGARLAALPGRRW